MQFCFKCHQQDTMVDVVIDSCDVESLVALPKVTLLLLHGCRYFEQIKFVSRMPSLKKVILVMPHDRFSYPSDETQDGFRNLKGEIIELEEICEFADYEQKYRSLASCYLQREV
jgi:hypothetical protein